MTSLYGDRPIILNLEKRNSLVTHQRHSTVTLRQRNAGISDLTFPAFLFVLRNAMQNYWIGLSQVNYAVVKWADSYTTLLRHAEFRAYCLREICYLALVIYRVSAILRGSRGYHI
jgi:hypothetical protein